MKLTFLCIITLSYGLMVSPGASGAPPSTTSHADDSRLPPCDAGSVSHVQSLNLSGVGPWPQGGTLSM